MQMIIGLINELFHCDFTNMEDTVGETKRLNDQ